jgi:hypothetical protein
VVCHRAHPIEHERTESKRAIPANVKVFLVARCIESSCGLRVRWRRCFVRESRCGGKRISPITLEGIAADHQNNYHLRMHRTIISPWRALLLFCTAVSVAQSDPIITRDCEGSCVVLYPASFTSLPATSLAAYVYAGVQGTEAGVNDIVMLFHLTTNGPSRLGWADFTVGADADGDFCCTNGTGGPVTVGQYTSPVAHLGSGGSLNERIPFALGVPFDVSLRSSAISFGAQSESGTGAYGQAYLRDLTLTELDGSPVQIRDAVPEPSSFSLSAFGIGVMLGSCAFRRRFLNRSCRRVP